MRIKPTTLRRHRRAELSPSEGLGEVWPDADRGLLSDCLYSVDDERRWESRPRLRAEEFALEDVTDEEWDALRSALADA
jgi:hypothetical protein